MAILYFVFLQTDPRSDFVWKFLYVSKIVVIDFSQVSPLNVRPCHWESYSYSYGFT